MCNAPSESHHTYAVARATINASHGQAVRPDCVMTARGARRVPLTAAPDPLRIIDASSRPYSRLLRGHHDSSHSRCRRCHLPRCRRHARDCAGPGDCDSRALRAAYLDTIQSLRSLHDAEVTSASRTRRTGAARRRWVAADGKGTVLVMVRVAPYFRFFTRRGRRSVSGVTRSSSPGKRIALTSVPTAASGPPTPPITPFASSRRPASCC